MCSPARDALRRAYPDHVWSRARHGGSYSGAEVWRLAGDEGLYVKIVEEWGGPDPGASPLAEAERLAWLRGQNVPCPQVVDAGVIEEWEYLVTREAPGRAACEEWPAHRRMDVVDALADFARDLHALPVDACPFDRTLKTTAPAAQEIAALGEVDMNSLDPRRRGWSSTRLILEMLTAARQVGREEPAVCHGDYCLPNVLLDPDTLRVTAVVDTGRAGVADRYQDLALATRSLADAGLNVQFGPEHAARFLYRYGESPVDVERIDFYRLLDEFF
ncbi:MAG: APH(3') family aminoglycoside O-phosphotransferase [Stackebrandtia sp.]